MSLEEAQKAREENPKGRFPESPWRGVQRAESKGKGKQKPKGKEKGKKKRVKKGGEGVDDPTFEPRGPQPPPGSGHHGGPGGGGEGSEAAPMIAVRAFRVVRDQGQEWDLVDEDAGRQQPEEAARQQPEDAAHERSEDEAQEVPHGPRTEGELPEFPARDYPARYVLQDGRPFPRVPEIPTLPDGRPAIGHLERIEPIPIVQPGPTPLGVYGLPVPQGFHQLPYRDGPERVITYSVNTSEGPPSHPGSSEGPICHPSSVRQVLGHERLRVRILR